MVDTALVQPEIDLIECLKRQNLYQRLGMKTNQVTDLQIVEAHASRRLLLSECISDLDPKELREAERILDEARDALATKDRRANYDRLLAMRQGRAHAVSSRHDARSERQGFGQASACRSESYRFEPTRSAIKSLDSQGNTALQESPALRTSPSPNVHSMQLEASRAHLEAQPAWRGRGPVLACFLGALLIGGFAVAGSDHWWPRQFSQAAIAPTTNESLADSGFIQDASQITHQMQDDSEQDAAVSAGEHLLDQRFARFDSLFVPPATISEAWETCRVTFQTEGHLQVTALENYEAQVFESLLDEDGSHYWDLPPGNYRVSYKISGNPNVLEERISVSDGSIDKCWELPVPEPGLEGVSNDTIPVLKATENAGSESSTTPTRYEYVIPQFAFQPAIAKHQLVSQEQLEAEIYQYFRPYQPTTLTKEELEQRYATEGLRDPRLSFTYALVAYQANLRDLALKFCYRATAESERCLVPFTLPAQFASYLELTDGRYDKAVRVCRDTLFWMSRQQSTNSRYDFDGAVSDLAWWTGVLAGFLQTTRPHGFRTRVDLQGLASRFYAAGQADTNAPYQRGQRFVAQRFYELSAPFEANVIRRRVFEEYEDDTVELFREKNRRARERWLAPPWAPLPTTPQLTFDIPGHRAYYGLGETGDESLRADLDSVVGIRTLQGDKPEFPVPAAVDSSPFEFTHYQPIEVAQYVNWMRRSIANPDKSADDLLVGS